MFGFLGVKLDYLCGLWAILNSKESWEPAGLSNLIWRDFHHVFFGIVPRQNIIGTSCARFLTVKRVGEHPYLGLHLAGFPPCFLWYNPSMPCLLRLLFFLFIRSLRSRRHLLLENLALRQQLAVLARRRSHPRFSAPDKLLWVVLRRLWTGWRKALILAQPDTVVLWHRSGFKLYWKWRSRDRKRPGRKCVSREVRELIFRTVLENKTWGTPRIHGELEMLGYDVSERSVLRWMRKAPRDTEPAKRWAAFLVNHRETIAAMDFFTVPTLTFGVLYCFFVIAHDRRRVLHFNVTRHPTSAWIVQQLREAFPYDSAPKYLIFDRGANFNQEVIDTVKNFGTQPKRTSFRSPWQNGVAERWVGACRRDLLDHVIVLNERHLKRLMNEYVRYYHDDRTHLALDKGTPAGREAEKNPDAGRKVISMQRLGGLHHRYDLAA